MVLIKTQIVETQPQHFLFSKSEVGQDNLHFNKFPGDAVAADLGIIFESYCSKQMHKTGMKGKRGKARNYEY